MKRIPEKVNKFNVYNSGDKLVGSGDELTLPDINWMAETVSGPGISGEYDDPTIGLLEKMEVEVPFKTLSADMADMASPLKPVQLTIRASQQSRDTDGNVVFTNIKAAFKGRCKAFSPGQIKQGSPTGAKITLSLTNYVLVVDDVTIYDIDILNDRLIINGEDILAAFKDLC